MTVNTQNNSGLNKNKSLFSVVCVKVFQLAGKREEKKEGKRSSRKLNMRCLFISHQLETSHGTILNSDDFQLWI